MEKSKVQFSNTDKKLYFIIGIIILVVMIVTIFVGKNKKDEIEIGDREEITEEELEEDKNQKLVAVLQDMEERERMEFYFSIFLSYVEEGKYEKAYQLLYEDFKNTYFPTLEDFENYIPTVFSEMSSIEHENIERSGDVYILWLSISDAVNGSPDNKREMNFVIREIEYNDFEMSFSVI